MVWHAPAVIVGFIIGFSPRSGWITCTAGTFLIGYYWSCVVYVVLRLFAAACLRGWA